MFAIGLCSYFSQPSSSNVPLTPLHTHHRSMVVRKRKHSQSPHGAPNNVDTTSAVDVCPTCTPRVSDSNTLFRWQPYVFAQLAVLLGAAGFELDSAFRASVCNGLGALSMSTCFSGVGAPEHYRHYMLMCLQSLHATVEYPTQPSVCLMCVD